MLALGVNLTVVSPPIRLADHRAESAAWSRSSVVPVAEIPPSPGGIERGHAGGGGHPVSGRGLLGSDGVADPFGDRVGAVRVAFREQHGQLVTAEASDVGLEAQRTPDALGHLDERAVSAGGTLDWR